LRIVDEIEAFLEEPAERAARKETLRLMRLRRASEPSSKGIAGGLDNTEIAASLGLSEKPSATTSRVYSIKIGVAHRYQAIVLARDAGLGTNNRVISER